MLFSFIIPTFNYAKSLPRALNSIVMQSFKDYEIIIMDDGSTDNTKEVAKALISQHTKAQIHYHYQANKGVATARNKGVQNSKGQYIWFLDADDELAENSIQQMHQEIIKQPEIEVWFGDYYAKEKNANKKIRRNKQLKKSPVDRVNQYIDKQLAIAHGAMVCQRKVFGKINYPTHLAQGEDIPVFVQCLALCSCSLVHKPLSIVHKHTGSLRNQIATEDNFAKQLTDSVFSHAEFPDLVLKLKNKFLATRHLSEFRSHIEAGEYAKAKRLYKLGFCASKLVAIKPRYLTKRLRLLFK